NNFCKSKKKRGLAAALYTDTLLVRSHDVASVLVLDQARVVGTLARNTTQTGVGVLLNSEANYRQAAKLGTVKVSQHTLSTRVICFKVNTRPTVVKLGLETVLDAL